MAAPPIPNVAFRFPNNNLGATPPSPGGIIAVLGACTHPGLDINEPRTIGGSPQNVVDVAGYGPAADLAANLVQGGATVVVVPVDYTPATPSAVTHTGTGLSVMTVSGDPFDQYFVRVRVVRAGVAQSDPAPGFVVSLDNGNSETGTIRMPDNGVYSGLAATTGLTLNFTAASMVVGDLYEFTTGAPTVAAADVVSAITALRKSTEPFSVVHVVGAFDASDVNTIYDEFATLQPKKRFAALFVETVDGNGETEADWMADLEADFGGTVQNDYTCVWAGNDFVRSQVLNCLMWRSVAFLASIRLSQVAVSRDLGAGLDGPLLPFVNGAPVVFPKRNGVSGMPAGYFIHDEALNPGLNANQFATQMSKDGETGYFVTNPNIMSGPTSDYSLLQFRRTSNEIARLTNINLSKQLSDDVLLNPQTGKILDREAKTLEQGNDAACSSLVGAQNVSALGTIIGRDADIINFEPIPVTVRWVPKGYLKSFDVTIAVSRTA